MIELSIRYKWFISLLVWTCFILLNLYVRSPFLNTIKRLIIDIKIKLWKERSQHLVVTYEEYKDQKKMEKKRHTIKDQMKYEMKMSKSNLDINEKKEWIIRIEKNYQLIQNELVNSSLALWHKNKQILKENQKRRETTSNQWATVKWTKRKPIGYYHSRDTLAP